MRSRVSLDEILKNPNINWDPDSTIKAWENFYIPYYKGLLDTIVDFDKLYFARGKYYRVYAPVKLKGYEDIQFGGDVIVNNDYLKNKYEFWNLGLLPRNGNLQGVKKHFGNDRDIGLFLKKVYEYYCGKNRDIMVKIGRSNLDCRKKVLQLLSLAIDEGGVYRMPQNADEAICNFCYKLYGVSGDIVTKLLYDYSNEAINDFWEYRKGRLNDICKV